MSMRQDIWSPASIAQVYPLGHRYAIDDRVFRYARAGGPAGAILDPDFGAKNTLMQHVAYANVLTVLAPAGSKSLTLLVAATDGAAGTGAIAANELSGGSVIIFTVATQTINARIVTNTLVAAPGGAMTITIDKPLPMAVTNAMHVELIANMFSAVRTETIASPIGALLAQMSVVGMPTVPCATGLHSWLQTWGPKFGAPDAFISIGGNNRAVYFAGNGSFCQPDATDINFYKGQYAGFVMANDRTGLAMGAPFVFLQLMP